MRKKDVERLDLETLKNLISLKERNRELLRLETRRDRIKQQLDETENKIRAYLKKKPAAKNLLSTVRAAASRSAQGIRIARPRGWLREQVTAVLRSARKPLTPADIRDRITDQHPDQVNKNLYISIFQLLKRNDDFKMTAKGWTLA